MTTYTDHGLVCLDDTDYAAIALAIQTDAVATDAALTDITASFNSVNSQPYALLVTTTGNGPLITVDQEYTEGNWSLVSSRGLPISAGGGVFTGSAASFISPISGWFEYGNYVNLTLAGAATAFSRRNVFARAYGVDTYSGIPVRLDEVRWRTVENSVAGGEFLIASGGTFYATAGQLIYLTATWSHANLASGVSSTVGALFWLNYISTGIEIGSA